MLEAKGKVGLVLSSARSNAERHRKKMEKWSERTREAAPSEVTSVDGGQGGRDGAEPKQVNSRETFAVPAPVDNISSQLARLAELKSTGALTEEEFTAGKARLLG